MCGLFARYFGLSTVSLRLFNVYGLRQPRSGPYALVLGIFLERLVNNQHLIIHGTGEQSRDFIHVKDIAEANMLALESSAANALSWLCRPAMRSGGVEGRADRDVRLLRDGGLVSKLRSSSRR